MIKAETLASISEYGEESRPSSVIGLSVSATASTYGTGYVTRSQSGESLNTLTTGTITNRSYKNGDRKPLNSETPTTQRLRGKAMAQKRNYDLCKKVRVTFALIGILLLVAAIFMLSFYLPKQYSNTKSDNEILVQSKKKLRFIWDDNVDLKDGMLVHFSTNFSGPAKEHPNIALKGYFGELLSPESKMHVFREINNRSVFMRFDGNQTTLEISKVDFHDRCYNIHWTANYYTMLQDCFDTVSSHWFGLGEMFHQSWPISKATFNMTSFLTNDYLQNNNIFGSVLEPLAINSNGAGIYVSESLAFSVSMNELKNGMKKAESRKFCIRTTGGKCYINQNFTNELNYTICIADNIREVHRILFNQYIEKPKSLPDKRMILEPIWCTWSKYKTDINQTEILKYAEAIKNHKFACSHLVIDHKYSTKYGDFNFDPVKFDDVSNMINRLRSLGFRTVVSVTPFTNIDSKLFLQEERKGRWIKVGSRDKNSTGIVEWWNGVGVVLDTTNSEATKWFYDRLNDFKKLKLDGFKFDGGEVNSLPLNYVFHNPQINPSYYSKYYVELASKFSLSEVRVGYKSQIYPIFVRLLDRRSGWNQHGGLRSVLSAVLTFSILGYSYIIPDMVAGNDYVASPNKELYVRWTQLCAFLPSIQFSIPPWDFDNEVVQIVHKALDIRRNLSNYMLALANNVTITGEPIVRPLWWYWPTDTEAFTDMEFMLGDLYLIAPVLNANIVHHAIYLPPGIWEEQWGQNRKTINKTEGGIETYPVDLHTICYFKLIKLLPGQYQ